MRTIDLNNLRRELRRMRDLNVQVKIPNIDGYFQRILENGCLERNPAIYHLYEPTPDGDLRGYTGLIPLYEASYRSFLAGERFPFEDFRTDDMLCEEEYRDACLTGVYIWIEAFVALDAAAQGHLGEFLFAHLAERHLKGLLVATSTPADEKNCEWWGLTHVRDGAPCPTGIRRLWYAEESVLVQGAEHPMGHSVPIRTLFMSVRARFSPQRKLALSPMQRRVAQLYYMHGLTGVHVASRLGIRPDTVKDHLTAIKDKAERVLRTRVTPVIAAWLQEHPGELLDP